MPVDRSGRGRRTGCGAVEAGAPLVADAAVVIGSQGDAGPRVAPEDGAGKILDRLLVRLGAAGYDDAGDVAPYVLASDRVEVRQLYAVDLAAFAQRVFRRLIGDTQHVAAGSLGFDFEQGAEVSLPVGAPRGLCRLAAAVGDQILAHHAVGDLRNGDVLPRRFDDDGRADRGEEAPGDLFIEVGVEQQRRDAVEADVCRPAEHGAVLRLAVLVRHVAADLDRPQFVAA